MKNSFGLPKKVGVIFSDVKKEYFPTQAQYLTEKGADHDALVVAKYLEKLEVTPLLYPGNALSSEKLRKNRPDMVINLVDSVIGNEYLSATIPGVLELLEIPYTGAGILGMSLDHNKFLVKKLLQQSGIPIPYHQLIIANNDPLDTNLRFPLISKLNEIHGAVEITEDAVSDNEKHLRDRLKYLISTYEQPILIEEFIVGREITAILLEGLNKKIYLAEKIFTKEASKYIYATFEDQWKEGIDAFHYQKYEDPVLTDYVKRAFDITKMADYAKFDVRLDYSGRYFFIDTNCNPAFGPKELECAMASILDLYNISFLEILKRILLNTMRDAQGKAKLPITDNGNA